MEYKNEKKGVEKGEKRLHEETDYQKWSTNTGMISIKY